MKAEIKEIMQKTGCGPAIADYAERNGCLPKRIWGNGGIGGQTHVLFEVEDEEGRELRVVDADGKAIWEGEETYEMALSRIAENVEPAYELLDCEQCGEIEGHLAFFEWGARMQREVDRLNYVDGAERLGLRLQLIDCGMLGHWWVAFAYRTDAFIDTEVALAHLKNQVGKRYWRDRKRQAEMNCEWV